MQYGKKERGVVERSIQHKGKLSTVSISRLQPSDALHEGDSALTGPKFF